MKWMAVLGVLVCAVSAAIGRDQLEERLSFQTFAPWSPRIHLNADVAIVYGIDPGLPVRIKTWRDRGYRIHVMTGVAWGDYADYLDGKFDGKNHRDEAQTDRNGKPILHGGDPNVPYMSPGENYGKYLCIGVKRALDAGAEAIHLEEPEFWVNGGYEPNFKREWKAYYGDEWLPPHSSPDAQYRASKLKYYLYRRALAQVFQFVQEYGKEHGKKIACYVPTHSLINYAHWKIVSPESSLLEVGCDGYIAQVWTGTARTPNVYEGVTKERTFETAFLEYGAMQNLVRASGRRVWYLNDPVEDDPSHSWVDYRYNWECTLTASLLQPEVWHYEIMPWPDRVFRGRYKADDRPDAPRVGISREYEVELQAVMTALGDMKQQDVRWEMAGTQGVGVLVSDTMMFQRGGKEASDPHLGSFYGLALPLLKRGIPIEPVQIETAGKPGFLDRYKLLLVSYEGQKPPAPEFHDVLAAWVKRGGALVVIDDDADPFNRVQDWWNKAPMSYPTPRQHLFERLGIEADGPGQFTIGKGLVRWEKLSPAALTYQKDGAQRLRSLCATSAKAVGLAWSESPSLVLRRGPYLVMAGLDESIPGADAPVLRGRYVNLFTHDLPVIENLRIEPAKRYLLVDLDRLPKDRPGIAAAACRVLNQEILADGFRFRADGIAESKGVVCIVGLDSVKSVTAGEVQLPKTEYEFDRGVLKIRFPNSIDGVNIQIRR